MRRKIFFQLKRYIRNYSKINDPTDVFKSGKLYLTDAYHDTIATTKSNAQGAFTFYDIKLTRDFIIKLMSRS